MMLLLLPTNGYAQEAEPTPAELIWESMTEAERVGQLFVVTFSGTDTSSGSDIAELVQTYHVGGVILRRANNNFSTDSGTPLAAVTLANNLQSLSLTSDASTFLQLTADIPLFIGFDSSSVGLQMAEILSGVTALPNPMSIGATWKPSYAQTIGAITGQELAAMGINLFLGPSLNIAESQSEVVRNQLGTNSFGGNPHWVSSMGMAYIDGLQAGSNGRLAIMPNHFPGIGNSDRSRDQEVGTISKSLEHLQTVEFAPFIAATNAESPVHGLMNGHVRYQSLQDISGDQDAPISFDNDAMSELLSLDDFAPWREAGGLLFSDSLGLTAVRRQYTNTDTPFPHRQIARDAFLAGNDLLYLSQFAENPDDFVVHNANIIDTITFFQTQYVADEAFRERIDEAGIRVVQAKLDLYPDGFVRDTVFNDIGELADIVNTRRADVLDLAQNSIVGLTTQTAAPSNDEKIVVFTDVRVTSQCDLCANKPIINTNDLADRLVALYGPEASGQVNAENIQSFSYEDLQTFLDNPDPVFSLPPTEIPADATNPSPTVIPTPEPSTSDRVRVALTDADWVIFGMLDVTADIPQSNSLNRFLIEQEERVRNANVVAFAFNTPYFLDSTEIAKLSGYYAVMSHTEPFIDTAARVLFQEIPLHGALPISQNSVGYDLNEITLSKEDQIISLQLTNEETDAESDIPFEVVVGDTLSVSTGIILDNNNNPVPDGTLVVFSFEDRLEGFTTILSEEPTINGVATLDFLLEDRTGEFAISAASGAATVSQQIDISIGDNVTVIMITPTAPPPTLVPTNTPTPIPTETPTPQSTETIPPTTMPEPNETPIPNDQETSGQGGFIIVESEIRQLFALVLGLLGVGIFGSLWAAENITEGQGQRISFVLWGVISGLIFYIVATLGLSNDVNDNTGSWVALAAVLIGGLFGMYFNRQQE